MDKEMEELFEEYDFKGDFDEEQFRRDAEVVSENFEKKMKDAGRAVRFAQDAIALFRYFQDGRIAWQKKAIVVAALVYFIVPFDAIPDLVPLVGYLDDFGVVAAVAKFMSDELRAYYP
jgi:uncharacterized membrane protein YkvA (DUF1232 family)